MDNNFYAELGETKNRLDAYSSSFCLAKWLQVTIHLQNGFNHSCHHPDLHKIELAEIEKNPAALHNTAFKKELWRKMRNGIRPDECEFCWKVEDSTQDFSDRVIKSNDNWAKPNLDKIASRPLERDINPSYVEVSFGYECNFKCIYCSPQISSAIWRQYEKHGPFAGRFSLEEIEKQGKKPYRVDNENPYLKAFWRWFPDLSKDLKVFRITGGEPLVNKNTFKVLDFIDENPLPELELAINSNLGIPDRSYDLFLDKVQKLTIEKKIKKFVLFTSIDTHGKQAEYIRDGLNYDKWHSNVKKYLHALPWDISFMVTFNVLSVPKFIDLLNDILELNKISIRDHRKRTTIDITHLLNPQNFSPWILTKPWRNKIVEIKNFMDDHSDEKVGTHGFINYERHKIKRIIAWIESYDPEGIDAKFFRRRLYKFFEQMEKREGKIFLDYFPEMKEFYEYCLSGIEGIQFED